MQLFSPKGFVLVFEGYLFFFFLGPYPRHMEVPRLGVELELQVLELEPHQCGVQAISAPVPQLKAMLDP